MWLDLHTLNSDKSMKGGTLTVCDEQENKKYRISLSEAQEVLRESLEWSASEWSRLLIIIGTLFNNISYVDDSLTIGWVRISSGNTVGGL